MKEIANNPYYQIGVDFTGNRLHLKLTGFWKNRSAVPNFLSDLDTAASQLVKGFTVLTDASAFITPNEDVVALLTQAQEQTLFKGLIATAEILDHNAFARLILDKLSTKTGMPKACFDNREQAETWLNEQVEKSVEHKRAVPGNW